MIEDHKDCGVSLASPKVLVVKIKNINLKNVIVTKSPFQTEICTKEKTVNTIVYNVK
jgi:hypothetical protein